MNTELIDKAIDELKGVWPRGTEFLAFGSGDKVTKTQFKARVAGRQNKPDWVEVLKAEPNAKSLFQDVDGYWCSSTEVAVIKDGAWYTSDCWDSYEQGEVIGDWQDTLEERPVEVIGIDMAEGDSVTSIPVQFMPEVDGVYELHNDECHGLSYGEDLIGNNVTVKALWVTEDGIHVAAVEHESTGYVFRTSMLRPIQSARDNFVDNLKHNVYLYAINNVKSISMRQSTGEEIAESVLRYVYEQIKAGQIPGVKLTD